MLLIAQPANYTLDLYEFNAKLAFFAKPANVMEKNKGEILAALKSFWLVGKSNRIKVSGNMHDADEKKRHFLF